MRTPPLWPDAQHLQQEYLCVQRQTGQVWGHKPANPEHLVAAAASALAAPPAGHGFHLPVTDGARGRYTKPQGPVQRPYFSESADPLPPTPHTPWGEVGTPPLLRTPSAACHYPPLPHRHLVPSPHATGYSSSLFQSCFLSGLFRACPSFSLEFVKREARVGGLMESGGDGRVVGGRGTRPRGLSSLPGRDLDEEGGLSTSFSRRDGA